MPHGEMSYRVLSKSHLQGYIEQGEIMGQKLWVQISLLDLAAKFHRIRL